MTQTVTKNPNWWSRRSRMEKVLMIISIVCSLTSVALIISLVYVMLNDKIKEVCLTPGCVAAASKILGQMDQAVKPCDNFYDFACGQFVKDTIIPDDKAIVDPSGLVTDMIQEQLRTMITLPVEDCEIEPFKMIKKLYLACMNKTLIEERGLSPILNIHKSLGGWPVLQGTSWDEKSWSWQQSVKNFRKHGYSTEFILKTRIVVDLKNSIKSIINIDQADLGLSREYLVRGIEDPVVTAYHSYQVDIAVLYGADRKRAEREMRDVLKFELALANISLPNEERYHKKVLYEPISIKELQKKYSYNDWLKYFNDILPAVIQVTEDEVIIIEDISFFDGLGPLLKKTPKRTIANYVIWRITEFSSTFLTEQLRKRRFQYRTVISGQQEQKPRWKECLYWTSESLCEGVGALYVRKYFNQSSKAAVLEMVNLIKEEFEAILKKLPWMDDKTKAAALSKVKAMVTHIGYPDELMDDKKLIELYKDINVDENKYLESILSIHFSAYDQFFKKLHKPVNKTDWITHSESADVHSYYSQTENSILFPAGILQGQFFSADRPRYMNYGAIGFMIGHVITRGFDDQGSQYDSNGNLVDWWEEDTKVAYLEKARCIIEQFGNFTEPNVNLKLNGINTQGTNIADNGGIKGAYLAYKKFAKQNGVEQKLPGLTYTSDQLFWISAAQSWCSVQRPEDMNDIITIGEHGPSKFRVLGFLSNMEEFSKDFQCPEGSPMNPTNKCKVW